MGAANAVLVVAQLLAQIPWLLTGNLRRVECDQTLTLLAMAGGAYSILSRAPTVAFPATRVCVSAKLGFEASQVS